MPSLSSFLPTVKPGDAALDEKRGDAAVAGLGIDVGEDDEQAGFVAVGDPQLASGEHPVAVALGGARRHARTHRCPSRPPTARTRRSWPSPSSAGSGVLMSSLPQRSERVDHQRVLHVDQHADRRIDARQRLDRQDRVEEARAAAAVALGNLDAHHAEVEQLVDERAAESSRARPSRGRCGRISRSANSSTLSRNSRSSSARVVRAGTAVCECVVTGELRR